MEYYYLVDDLLTSKKEKKRKKREGGIFCYIDVWALRGPPFQAPSNLVKDCDVDDCSAKTLTQRFLSSLSSPERLFFLIPSETEPADR